MCFRLTVVANSSRWIWVLYKFTVYADKESQGEVTRQYKNELSKLSTVFRAARQSNVSALSRTIESWLSRPMIMVGSGGSYSTASFAAFLHEQSTGQVTRSATPLDVVTRVPSDSGMVCFSASGHNRDIISAFRYAVCKEISPLAALVLTDGSPLAELAARTWYTDLISMPHPSYKDGFLAVASLLASCLLLLRGYRAALGQTDTDIPQSLNTLVRSTTSLKSVNELSQMLAPVTDRKYISVLYTPALAPAAVDLESRFVEAALGALHIADLRNFGHGRHVWLAKRSEDTGVVALIGDGLASLNTKTLDLLPESVPVAPIEFDGAWDVQALAGIVVGLYLAETAGQRAGIDPGKPRVPAFGRALYRLAPQNVGKTQAELNQEAALRRKRQHVGNTDWVARHGNALARLNTTRFDALVVDYDGTLCQTSARFDPLLPGVAKELTRLCQSGATLGIATGRGASAGKELRRALPADVHDRVFIGYYNGAEIRPLTDTSDPLLPELESTHPLLESLANDAMFGASKVRTRNRAQVSVGLNRSFCIDKALSRAYELMRCIAIDGSVVASSHSIDILLQSQSKRGVVDAVAQHLGKHDAILRLGDRGGWPGNDAALLDDPYGLSVDDVSTHPEHCWALAPAGVKGVQATLYYLHRLKWSRSGGRIKLTPGARG